MRGRVWSCEVEYTATFQAMVGVWNIRFGKKLTTPVGKFTKVDVVAWRGHDQIHIGNILVFFEDVVSEVYFAYLDMYKLIDGTKWSSENATPTVVASSQFLANLLWYAKDADIISVAFPRAVRS